MAISSNKIRCLHCGDEIESKHGQGFKWCGCGNVAVDGGKNYLRRIGNRGDWLELSTFTEDGYAPTA